MERRIRSSKFEPGLASRGVVLVVCRRFAPVSFFPRDRRFIPWGFFTLVQGLSLALALVRLILHESERSWPPKCERLWFGQFQSRRSGSHWRLTTSDGGFSAASISPPTSTRQLTREDCVRAHTQPTHVNSGATLKDACLETVLREEDSDRFLRLHRRGILILGGAQDRDQN